MKKDLFTSRLSPHGSLGLSGHSHLYIFDFCHPHHLQTTPRPQTTVTTTPQLSALDSKNHVLHCRASVIPSVLPTACPSAPKRLRDGPPETPPSQGWRRQDDRPVSGSGRVKGPAGAETRSHCMTNTEGRKDGESPERGAPFPSPSVHFLLLSLLTLSLSCPSHTCPWSLHTPALKRACLPVPFLPTTYSSFCGFYLFIPYNFPANMELNVLLRPDPLSAGTQRCPAFFISR